MRGSRELGAACAGASESTKSSSSGLEGSIVKPPPPIAKMRRCSDGAGGVLTRPR